MPMQRCGEMWKGNGQRIREAKCTRRLLMLFISHFVEHCESLSEIPKGKLRGRSTRTCAYDIASRETGEEVKDLKLMATWSRKYLKIATGAGLSRFAEISDDKSWFSEKKMNEADIQMACQSLREQHGKMTEAEKKLRSGLDFRIAQYIAAMLERFGLAKETLVKIETGLVRVLGEFLDPESLRLGEIKQKNEDLDSPGREHQVKGLPTNAEEPSCTLVQESSSDPPSLFISEGQDPNHPPLQHQKDSTHALDLSADTNNSSRHNAPCFIPAMICSEGTTDADHVQSNHALERGTAGSILHSQPNVSNQDMAVGWTQSSRTCAAADSSNPRVSAPSHDGIETSSHKNKESPAVLDQWAEDIDFALRTSQTAVGDPNAFDHNQQPELTISDWANLNAIWTVTGPIELHSW